MFAELLTTLKHADKKMKQVDFQQFWLQSLSLSFEQNLLDSSASWCNYSGEPLRSQRAGKKK